MKNETRGAAATDSPTADALPATSPAGRAVGDMVAEAAGPTDGPGDLLPPGEAHTVDELLPDHDNANKGTERGTALIEQSIRRLGFARPIVATAKGQIIGGNKTLEAAVNAGLVKVRYVDSVGGEVIVHRRRDIDDIDTPEARELALADNFLHDASFDDVLVVKRHAEAHGIDIENVGLNEEEFKALLKRAVVEERQEQDPTAGLDPGDGRYVTQHGVIVVCPDAELQKGVFEDLMTRYGDTPGFEVRIVNT